MTQPKEKPRFRVGDRVAVYGWVQMYANPFKARSGGRGKVMWIGGDAVRVMFDKAMNGENGGDLVHYEVHPKQCRRLKPRAPLREFWLDDRPGVCRFFKEPPYNAEELVHVKEVRPARKGAK